MLWKDANPAASDVAGFLSAQGFTPPEGIEPYLGGAIREIQSISGFTPFLGDTEAKTWYFDPPDTTRKLDLLGGFWQITSITAGVTAYSEGTLLVEGQDYELKPYNAANEERGWDEVLLYRHWGTARRSIVILGKRGYAQKLPIDVWQSIVEEAACGALLKTVPGFGIPQRIKQGPVDLDFGAEGIKKLTEWHDRFDATALRYQRLVM